MWEKVKVNASRTMLRWGFGRFAMRRFEDTEKVSAIVDTVLEPRTDSAAWRRWPRTFW